MMNVRCRDLRAECYIYIILYTTAFYTWHQGGCCVAARINVRYIMNMTSDDDSDHWSPSLQTSKQTQMIGCKKGLRESFRKNEANMRRTRQTFGSEPLSSQPCINGVSAGIFPCQNVDLESFIPISSLTRDSRTIEANEVWGWTNATTGQEYAMIGTQFGVTIVDVTVPSSPVTVGSLLMHGTALWQEGTYWHDIKTYKHFMLVVADEIEDHGVQVFDLSTLASPSSQQQIQIDINNATVNATVTIEELRHSIIGEQLKESSHYNNLPAAHNLHINEESGYAYLVGGYNGNHSCNKGGLHIIDLIGIESGDGIEFAGCYDDEGYTHDVQCVNYRGPDPRFSGTSEICFACNTDSVTIVDVTNKTHPVQLSKTTDIDVFVYTHQGWLTENQDLFIFGDEWDEESQVTNNTRTFVLDVTSLTDPKLIFHYDNPDTQSIDHDQYVKGDYTYQANYKAGLRILDIALAKETRMLKEVAHFDVAPYDIGDDDVAFFGAWSTYPYFESGTVLVSSIELGLFVLRPTFDEGIIR
jgi:choice-of-anchor B domain-containing protein